MVEERPVRRRTDRASRSVREEERNLERRPERNADRSSVRRQRDAVKSREQLEGEKRDNERRAEEANRILAQTRERKQASLGQLNALQQKISVQQGVISTIASEVTYLDHDVARTEEHVGELQLNLTDLKQEYARMIYAASKSTAGADKLMFLFAAESFNQFVMRLRYLRQYADVRRRQAAEIQATNERLQQQLHNLTQKRQSKQQLLGTEVAEKQSLVTLRTEQNQVVQSLSQQESQLQQEVAARQAAVVRLDQLIADRVRAEIARAARAARRAEAREAEARRREASRRVPASRADKEETARREADDARTAARELDPGGAGADNEDDESAAPTAAENAAAGRRDARIRLTPAATQLSASFAGNKGRLPWPVLRGFVSEHFGRHQHPVLRHVVVENRGVDIQTNGAEQARAVFAGQVLTVASVPGMNSIVMIQHGEYFTVYAKLRDVRVSSGQRVRTGDILGTVFTSPEGTTELQFQLWRNNANLNPESWLGRR